MCDVFIYSMGMGSGQEPDRERFAATLPCGLIHFHNSGRFHHGGFFLPLRKFQRAVAVDVDAGEFFAVTVIHGDLPMMMLAAAVAGHSACSFYGFLIWRFLFRSVLFQVEGPLGR